MTVPLTSRPIPSLMLIPWLLTQLPLTLNPDADPQPEADGMGASDNDTSSISHGEPIPS